MESNLQFSFDHEEANLVLHALGQLPYVQVADLIQKIQDQAGPQLVQMAGEAARKERPPVPLPGKEAQAS